MHFRNQEGKGEGKEGGVEEKDEDWGTKLFQPLDIPLYLLIVEEVYQPEFIDACQRYRKREDSATADFGFESEKNSPAQPGTPSKGVPPGHSDGAAAGPSSAAAGQSLEAAAAAAANVQRAAQHCDFPSRCQRQSARNRRLP